MKTGNIGLRFKRAQLEDTPMRRRVYSCLAQSSHPVTAREVFKRVKDEQAIDRVTVYRILKLFADRGLVRCIHTDEKGMRFCLTEESGSKNHPHFHCSSCGRVECLPGLDDTPLRDNLDQEAGVDIHFMEVVVHGTCCDCRRMP